MLSLKNGWLILGHTPAAHPGLSVFVFSREGEIVLISSEGKKREKGEEGETEGKRERDHCLVHKLVTKKKRERKKDMGHLRGK